MDLVLRRDGPARCWAGVLLCVLLLGPRARAGGAEVLERLNAAEEAGEPAEIEALLIPLRDAFNATEDLDLRLEILTEVGWVVMTGKPDALQVAAVRALAGFHDPDGAWEELCGFFPTADQKTASAVDLATVRAAETLAPDEARSPLLSLARGAANLELQVAAIRALAAWGPDREGREETARVLCGVVVANEPGPDPDASTRERWARLEPVLTKTLTVLLERQLDAVAHLREWQKEHGPLERKPWRDAVPQGLGGAISWPELARRLASDEEGGHRLAAADQVYDRALEGPDVRVALEALVASSKDWRTLSVALRALARQDTGAPVPRPLLGCAKAREWQVRLALAEGLVAYRHEDAIGALIDLLGDRRLRVRDGAAESLETLTGEAYGASQKPWARWYRKQKGEIRFLPRAARPKRAAGTDYAVAHNRFFGARIRSDRVALVLDKSESMYYGLFDRVVEEVAAFLSVALPTTFFGVIEFDAHPRPWKKRLVPANAGNAEDVIRFLQQAKPTGPTNIIDSLRTALVLRDIDSVVLLSDGLPNRGDPDAPDEILEQIRRQNRYARVSIHTLLMELGREFPHDGPKGDERPPLDEKEKARRGRIRAGAAETELGGFMKRLADQNEGTFGVVFADWYAPPPDARIGDSTDK